MTYVAIDKYLKNGGKLCIVITQTIFKTVGGGEGFRQFRLGQNGIPFKIIQVDDMVELQPFEAATNRTSVLLCQKSDTTTYPVEYHLWRKKTKGIIDSESSWHDIIACTSVRYLKAYPIVDEQSHWITIKSKSLKTIQKVLGKSYYEARVGVHTLGANGVFWINLVKAERQNTLIENYIEGAKRSVREVKTEVESDFIYPLMRGRDISKWKSTPSISIILPYNYASPNKPIDISIMPRKNRRWHQRHRPRRADRRTRRRVVGLEQRRTARHQRQSGGNAVRVFVVT